MENLVLIQGFHDNHCSTPGAILKHVNEHLNFNSVLQQQNTDYNHNMFRVVAMATALVANLAVGHA